MTSKINHHIYLDSLIYRISNKTSIYEKAYVKFKLKENFKKLGYE